MPEQQAFEEELVHALRRAGDDFPADQQRLALGGIAYGRRLRRRRAAAMAGGAAAIALVAVGGAVVAGPLGGANRTVAAPATAPSAVEVMTGKEMLEALKYRLPFWPVVKEQASDSRTGRVPGVLLTMDDGQGQVLIELTVNRLRTPVDLHSAAASCPEVSGPNECRLVLLPGGGRVKLEKNRSPDGMAPKLTWSATLTTPEGQWVHVDEANMAQHGDGPAEPPLTMDQLQTIVTDKAWQRAFNSIPTAAPSPGVGPAWS